MVGLGEKGEGGGGGDGGGGGGGGCVAVTAVTKENLPFDSIFPPEGHRKSFALNIFPRKLVHEPRANQVRSLDDRAEGILRLYTIYCFKEWECVWESFVRVLLN